MLGCLFIMITVPDHSPSVEVLRWKCLENQGMKLQNGRVPYIKDAHLPSLNREDTPLGHSQSWDFKTKFDGFEAYLSSPELSSWVYSYYTFS